MRQTSNYSALKLSRQNIRDLTPFRRDEIELNFLAPIFWKNYGSTCLSMTIHPSMFLCTIHRQPTSVVEDSCKEQSIWMVVAVFTTVLAI